MNLPPQFIERFTKIYNQKNLPYLSASGKQTVRINTLQTSVAHAEETLTISSIPFKRAKWDALTLIVNTSDAPRISSLDMATHGHIYIQNASSILASLILSPAKNSRVLDAAAAPGSKTSHLAAIMQNTGEIIANDISRERCYKLSANLQRLNVKNTTVITSPAERLWYKYPECFDYVLLDAPCSMESLIATDRRVAPDWSVKTIKRLAKRQKWLLRSALSCLKPGGTLVYSTCTIAPEENEGVINWLLEKEQEKIELEDIQYPHVSFMPGLIQWEQETYNKSLTKTKRVPPSEVFEAFYIAKMRKHTSTIPSHLRNTL